MTHEEIRTEFAVRRAMRILTEDGLSHYILRKGQNYADLEWASGGTYSLLVKIGDETHCADGNYGKQLAQLWRRWCAASLDAAMTRGPFRVA